MKLTKLVLENFRSVRERQEIDFAPVTLLLGPNSAGKTTILIALFYLQQILDREQCDPIYLEAMGNRRIDGFRSLVHNGDLNNVITIGIGFDPEQTIGVEYKTYLEELGDIFDIHFIKMKDIADETEKVYVEFKIAWSQLHRAAYIKNYAVSINNEFIGELSNDEYTKSSLVNRLNFTHPLLLPIDYNLWLESIDKEGLDTIASEFEISLNDLIPGLERNKSGATERVTSAWDKLCLSQQNDSDLIKKVSDWFSNRDKLNTNYNIFSGGEFDIKTSPQLLGLKDNVYFCKIDSSQMLFPNQVGVGLTQIAPLIIAANIVQDGLIAIEQPELHIHPALQLAVGDLFTQYPLDVKRPMFLVETHSEHILLRILKRIRQTTDNELPESNYPVKPDFISVIVFEDNNGSTVTRKIDITDDGDF
ncbi:AAA family ATPase, partial [Escherichia coli]|uniref:AAA family ATPase n=1 Tax=Escherichia coli TaxID=562 RepID=UPI00403D2D80